MGLLIYSEFLLSMNCDSFPIYLGWATIDREMKASNQSSEIEALSKGTYKGRWRWGLRSQSSQANNIQVARSPGNDTG